MARSRNIKPGFFKNEELAELSTDIRLLFIGLWLLADREGRLEDRPKRIRAELFPFDGFDVDSMLDQLQVKDFILRYEVEGNKYLYVKNFVKHQDPHYREKASEIPPPDGHTNEIKANGVTRSQRERILDRDDFTCQQCGSKDHLCIDHILPVSRGGESIDDNLQVLCLPCNTRKGNKINSETKDIRKPNNSGKIQEFGPNSIQGRIDIKSKQARDVPLIPDSLIPDSLIQKKKEGDKSPVDLIWTIGLRILTDAGASEKNARTFLGKHVKTNRERLAEVISQMAVNTPVEPIAYIEKALQPRKREVVV